jgi:hypothetical protein
VSACGGLSGKVSPVVALEYRIGVDVEPPTT